MNLEVPDLAKAASASGMPLITLPSEAGPSPTLQLAIAATPEMKEVAFSLRHQAYMAEDAITPRPSGLFFDDYDQLTAVRTHILYSEGQPVGSIRACTGDAIPAKSIYSAAILRELPAGARIVESNRFVTRPGVRLGLMEQFALFRAIALNATLTQADYIVTAVRPRHSRFYERFMRFKCISEEACYPGLTVSMLLMAANFKEDFASVCDGLPMLKIADDDVAEYRRCLESL